MIYKLFTENNDVYHRGPAYNQRLVSGLRRMNQDISDTDTFNWEIKIPRQYARMESDEKVKHTEVDGVDHYTIYITKQVGTPRNRRDCFLYAKFPNSNRLYKIILHMDGGVSYEKSEHRFMIRETDELDRRIVLGFCKIYQGNLVQYCYSDSSEPDLWILRNAASYRSNHTAKRIKQGSLNNNYPYRELAPYEEASGYNIFSRLAFI